MDNGTLEVLTKFCTGGRLDPELHVALNSRRRSFKIGRFRASRVARPLCRARPFVMTPRLIWKAERGLVRMGFTLLELLVVIVVIAILASLVAPNVFRHVGAAKDATARTQIEMLGTALDAYRLDTGRYPTTEQGLQTLWTRPTRDPLRRGERYQMP